MSIKILAFTGSLRKESLNKKLLDCAIEIAKKNNAEVEFIDLKELDLPLYDQDLEQAQGLPETVLKLKQIFLQHDALLIASPEHNSSYSAALKNVIDWVSRKSGDEASLAAFEDKIVAIISASPGQLGGLRGLSQLRILLENIRMIVIPDQLAVSVNAETFLSQELKNPGEQKKLEGIVKKLISIVSKLKESK